MLYGKQFLERQHSGLGDVAINQAARDWESLVPVLRMLEDFFPGCTHYDPGATFSKVSCWSNTLIEEAEHFASRDAARTYAAP